MINNNCCGIEFDEDIGICPTCKEHCDAIVYSQEEWDILYKDHLIEMLDVNEEIAQSCLTAAQEHIDYEKDDPIDLANDEISCWQE